MGERRQKNGRKRGGKQAGGTFHRKLANWGEWREERNSRAGGPWLKAVLRKKGPRVKGRPH